MASYTARKNKQGEIISYQIKVTRGRDKATGKQLTPYTMTYTPPEGWSKKAIERDLLKTMGEFESACARGEILTKQEQKEAAIQERYEERHRPTFSQYIKVFLSEKKPTFAAGTYENYLHALTRAEKVFGARKLSDIELLDIKEYLTNMQLNGANEKTGKPYHHKTIIKHYIVLRSFFSNALENEIIERNPMEHMKRPKPRKDEAPKKAIVYDEKQVQYILECINHEPLMWRALMLFAIDSGCRRGEIVGLKWENINLNTGRCEICNNAQYTTETGSYITTPKNGKSRTILLNPPVVALLKRWRKEQALMCFKLGTIQSGFVFTHDDGTMLNPQAPTAHFTRFGKKYNLEGIHPHALRHTMATISIANGADVVSVSQKLGHSSPAITLNVYSHANEEAQRRANEILESAIYNENQNRQAQ